MVVKTRVAEEQAHTAIPARSCGKVLAVDDDPEVRGMLVRLLEERGIQGGRGLDGGRSAGGDGKERP